MFLFPLLLCRERGWDLRSYFLGNLNGRNIEEIANCYGWFSRLRPQLIFDLTLPLLLHRWGEKKKRAKRETLEKHSSDITPQLVNLKRLRHKINKLRSGYKLKGIWSKYTQVCNYNITADQSKKTKITHFLKETRPKRVLDIGCNTGEYSRLSAEIGSQVIAVDSDHDAIEFLYRQLRNNTNSISPMVVDICSPSPGMGYLNKERMSFLERFDAECVICLALMHHLLISGNLSFAAIRDLLFKLTTRDLVFEFVPIDDDMFQRLIKFRVNLYNNITIDNCRDAFLARFKLIREEPIDDSKRTLLYFRK
jgi:2-polyprenyl-3-methyl-5-hydroxy-6-metoxy-1,4-benzoquinol methylase